MSCVNQSVGSISGYLVRCLVEERKTKKMRKDAWLYVLLAVKKRKEEIEVSTTRKDRSSSGFTIENSGREEEKEEKEKKKVKR